MLAPLPPTSKQRKVKPLLRILLHNMHRVHILPLASILRLLRPTLDSTHHLDSIHLLDSTRRDNIKCSILISQCQVVNY
jgi:hypothetical protein